MAYVPVLGHGGFYYPKWVNDHAIDHTFAERLRNAGQIGNPRWPGDDVFPQLNPDPVPWAVAFLLSAASSKAAAANMANKVAAQQIIAGADQAIASFIDSDDICPPWPFPGPPPWLSIIASELTLVANTLQEGLLRTGILQIAGQVLDRVALNPQTTTATGNFGHEDPVPGGSTGHLNASPGLESSQQAPRGGLPLPEQHPS
jgi:hypothetical protein